MKLFFSPGACSMASHIVLREMHANFTLEQVDLRKGQYSGGDFSKINPKGYVPFLQLDSGEYLSEGAAILQYLGDAKPEAKLLAPTGTMDRYRVVEWLTYIGTELHKSFSPLFREETPDPMKVQIKDQLGKRFEFVSQSLKGKSYLMGEQFTVADAYLFTVLGWAPYVKLDMSAWPTLQAYMAKVAARPAVQTALQAEGLTK